MRVKGSFMMLVGMAMAILLEFPLICRAEAADADQALVLKDSLPVYAKASLESTEVARLARGEKVTVTFEMLGAGGDGPWCSIAGESGITGYVQCGSLLRARGLDEEWQHLGSSSPQPAVDATKVILRGNQVLVPVVLRNGWNKEEVLLVLDTGAARTVIHSEVASRLKIDTGKAKKGLARIADGSVVATRDAGLDDLAVGPHLMEDLEVMIVDFKGPADYGGLLGMDVLRDLQYRIDFEKQQIVWL